ncbi:hypothetical protein GDO86_017258 [Hymenochirus boettgeri]|uniref:Vitellogenin n=1 Tax=Hymenochirus boettgeri TaxID=247094 RepID=A0A8T2ILR2_9PIPI|nr:hypothetical protein GDO86_017258 [Hymenochirus boettgeri]
MGSLRDELEKQPLHFSYQDGRIHKLCPSREEPTWALNAKRGILSVLQGNLKAPNTGRTIVEVDVLGRCPTTYELKGNSLWKRKDLTQCSNRVQGSSAIRSVALPDTMQLLDSHLECLQTFRDGTLTEATCDESHLITIFSRDGNGAKTQTQTLLKLIRTEADTTQNKDMSGNHYVTNLIYEKESISGKLKGDNVDETVRNLCLAPNVNYETADLFMNLVFELRLLSADALSDLWQRSSFKCRDNWQPLIDALPSCGTEACVGLMKEILLSKELEDEKTESFLWSFAFLPEPTTGMIGSLMPLLQEEGAGQSVYLALTSMVHHFCSATKDCCNVPEVQSVMKTLQGFLGDNCTVQEPNETHMMQVILKATGNAGLAAEPLIPILSSCALLKSNPDAIRLAAVEAFRRIPCSADHNTLTDLYQNSDENEEIRIAAYYTAMKCPSQELLHSVRQILKQEKSVQGSCIACCVIPFNCSLLKEIAPNLFNQYIGLNIPSQSQLNGSLVINGCESEMVCALTFNGNTSELHVRTECQPRMKVEMEFRHNLLVLKGVNEESKLSISVGKLSNYNIEMLLKSGTCSLEIKGDVHTDNKLQWKMHLENKCKPIQDLGAPFKIDGSGYIVVNKKSNLDSQMLIVVDESALQGLLILKASEKKQELDAVLTHNIQPAVNLGVPTKAILDMTTERSSEFYKRSVQLSLDNKQISEEMIFYQTADRISLSYTINHNLDALKKMNVEDRLDIEATVDLKETRNISVSTQYGLWSVNASMQVMANETQTSLAGTVLHNWPWLIQNRIPARVKAFVGIKATDYKQEMTLQAAAAEEQVTCTVAVLSAVNEVQVLFSSNHNSDLVQKYGYPKVVSLNGTSCTLCLDGNKSSATLDLVLNKNMLRIDMNAFKEQTGSFNVTAGVKHSVPTFHILGIPSITQMDLHFILTNKGIGGIWNILCDRKTLMLISANARSNQQRDELHFKAVHDIQLLQHVLPNSSNLVTRVSYSVNEAWASVFLGMDEKEFKLFTMINLTGPSYLRNIPAQVEIRTEYEKSHKACGLRHATIWGSKEVTFVGLYKGHFPKLTGGHEIMGEFSQSLFHRSIRHGRMKIYLEHSAHNHQDHISIGWDGKEQAAIISSLKVGKEHLDGRIGVTHPFSFAIRQLEISSLSERRGSKYNHQTQVGWNKGFPINLRISLDDRSENSSKVWNACVSFLPGQVQQLLHVGNLQMCGYMEKAPNALYEYINIQWDSKELKQTLMYEKTNDHTPDTLQVDATFDNVFSVSCSRQHVLARMQTNFLDTMDHILRLELCDLPHPIVISGKHILNKEELFSSENRLSFTPNERDDASMSLVFSDHGIWEAQNYSLSLLLKASEDINMEMTGRYISSTFQHQIQLQAAFSEKDEWVLNASKGNQCFYLNIAQNGSSGEKGVELSACTSRQHLAAVNTDLNINGVQDRLGHFVLSASNQSLSFSFQGCGDSIAKTENYLANMASQLKLKLLETSKKFDSYVMDFQKTVQRYDCLYEAAGWALKVSQDVARMLQNVPRTLNQIWKQSGLRQTLRHDLPIYFEKLNNLVTQMQTELQRPLVTLKEAYYDATLKPLEDVWQEKTEAWLRKINAFLPSIVKDEWLMDPVRRLVDALKTVLDLGTDQLLKWTDNKVSRAVSKIRKPLTRLFRYSIMLSIPLLPKEYHLTDLANITHYIIEEKLMKPIRSMYSVNPIAEYYRFKRKMMESPFEYHAVLIGNKHIVTFDGILLDVASKCSLLLAKDFVHNKFTLILHQGDGNLRSLHVYMNQMSIDIFPGLKIEENCQRLDLPVTKNGISIKKESNKVEMTNQEGITIQCDIYHDICSFTLQGWHHGISAGLFGTNDNESGNDFLVPDHTYTNSSQDFSLKWQVDTQCNPEQKKMKACPNSPYQKLCKALFVGSNSVLRNCFRVIYPQPFYSACVEDICDSNQIKPVCNLAAAYVHLCNRNFVPIDIPSQCA